MTPKQIGRYEIERRIGRGGMAVIFLARDPLMKRLVAIKVLPGQLNQDPKFRTRFQREVEVVASLEHPAIVPVHDFGEQDDQPYFVMRYMPGGSLRERLRKGTLSVTATAEIIRQIAPGLDAAHRKGIIHRDIKPGNILFDSNDTAYLGDFGIVKLGTASATFTGSAVLGTPSYMSPELARGDQDIDGRSDIYALGVLIFRMWTGVLPYTATTPMGIAMKHITDPVPRLLDYKPDLPPACQALISIAMAKDRKDRFETATALSQVLDLIAANKIWSADQVSRSIGTPEPGTAGQPESAADLAEAAVAAGVPGLTVRPTQADAPAPNNLPVQSSSFIGREDELAAISSRLAEPSCRLLTLLGPGGIGKTRVAIEAAQNEIHHFEHGVFFVPLAPLSAGEFIVPTLAEVVNFSFYSDEEPKTQLLNYLRGKQMLLVFDNFEHLIDSAGLVSDILQTSPHIKVLVTARERLNLQEEWILQIHGMAVPQGGDLVKASEFPSMQLFLERARRVKADFELTETEKPYAVRICQLLEGIPLGIELAAAWIRFLSCEEIAIEIEQNLDFLTSSLRNVSQRHRSLRAVFEYSWNLLTELERTVFRKLTVFRGGFTRQAALSVADASLFHLSALADKSLLRTEAEDHYEMLEVLKQYGKEKLEESPEESERVRTKHCEYFAEFLFARETGIKGSEQKEALEEIGVEIENVRAAWRWAIKTHNEAALSKALESLYRFYEIRGWFEEGNEMVGQLAESLRTRYGDTGSFEREKLFLYCRALARQGALNYRLGRHQTAEELLDKSIEISRQIDSRNDLGFALTYRGAVAYLGQAYEEARTYLQESLEIEKSDHDQLGTAIALHHLGLVARDTDDFPAARSLFQESLQVNKMSGNRYGIAISLNNLGMVARELGEHEEARELHHQSLVIREGLNDRWGIANSLDGLGLVAHSMGDNQEARQLLEKSLSIYEEIGDQRRMERTRANLDLVLQALHENGQN